MPDAYLFDIGNVIITFDYSRAIDRLANRCHVPPDDALRLVSSLSPAFERGDLEVDEFIRQASRAIGFEGAPSEFREAFEDIFELNHPMVEFIESKREAGAPLFLLSNTNAIHVPFFEATYSVFGQFHGRIYSHIVRCMKPEPEIYRIAVKTLGLEPERTVYIDDLPANCEAGRAAGFCTLQYDPGCHDAFLSDFSILSHKEGSLSLP